MQLSIRIENLKKALIAERDEELSRYASLLNEQSIQERIAAGVTLYPIDYVGERYTHFEDLLLEFRINENQDPDQFPANGKVHIFNGNNAEKVEGAVQSFKNNLLTVQLSDADLPDWMSGGKIGLNAVPDTRTTDIQLKTLDRIAAGELKIAEAFYKNGGKQEYAVVAGEFKGLNESQHEAANHLTASNPFHIVHGPPGTGKTKTLVSAISALVASGKKVLVTTPSNAAVDHITLELAKAGQKPVRLGNSFKTAEAVLPYTLKQLVLNNTLMAVVARLKKEAETVRKKAFKYKRNFGKEEYEERKKLRHELREIRRDIRNIENEISYDCLKSASVITGTFVGVLDKKLNTTTFDAVFVDEAGQALEPAIWSVAHFAPKLFLAGDPLQLPPTLFTHEAEKLGLSKSLIEQGIELGLPTTLLNVQYRMNRKIMHYSNNWFYDSKLNAHETVADAALNDEIYEAIEFIDTAGCGYDEKNDAGGGISNPGEVDIVKQRLAEFDLSSVSFGLISPYRRQVTLMQETFPELSGNCQTIDSFQGQERDLIVVSLVRSNESGTIGFLSDYRRMNVAMTRAKKKLVIIGDSATIGGDAFYKTLLDYIEKEGTYRSGWEFLG